jgi:hypothetical protein
MISSHNEENEFDVAYIHLKNDMNNDNDNINNDNHDSNWYSNNCDIYNNNDHQEIEQKKDEDATAKLDNLNDNLTELISMNSVMIHNDDDANDIHDDHISHALNEINTSIMSNKSCESNDDKYRVLEDIDDTIDITILLKLTKLKFLKIIDCDNIINSDRFKDFVNLELLLLENTNIKTLPKTKFMMKIDNDYYNYFIYKI